ncbi:helix-turn-helix domain-containing protein [Ferruginibacter sp.]
MSFGKKLKELRFQHNLTQEEMCEQLSMEQSTYSRYETDKSTPNWDVITRVIGAFEVSLMWLMESDAEVKEKHIDQIKKIAQSHKYYEVPKEVIESLLRQQQSIVSILEKILDNSV